LAELRKEVMPEVYVMDRSTAELSTETRSYLDAFFTQIRGQTTAQNQCICLLVGILMSCTSG
jgi:hypothetical protein